MKRNQVTWLSHHSYKGIVFDLGDNGPQLFYEAKVRGITWMVLRPKPSCHWCVTVERKGSLRLLNDRAKHWNGMIEDGPLYGKGDCMAEEPVALLEALAEYIHFGVDPFDKHQS